MKKFLLLILTFTVLLSALTVVSSAAFLGTGAEVIADEVTLIKTGLLGKDIVFSDTDFKSALGISEFNKITVCSIPSSTEGTLTLGSRRVYAGQTIKRKNISSLTFTPLDSSVTASSFTFKVDGSQDCEILCELKFIEKVNYAPKLNTDTDDTLSVTTQKGISVYGRIDANDPEGDDLDYIIVSYPKYGTVEITDSEMGEFKYTPNSDYDGKDSFVFVVRDEYGNYSSAETVSITVTERMSEVVYVDMESSKSYNAAVAMTALGIMSGSRIGDDMYFSPDEGVTRAEFVAMAMKVLGVKADSTLTSTFFDDNDEIPKPLVGYVATAARCGIINGSFDGEALNFRPNDNITKCEAAIIMSNLLEVKADSAVLSAVEGIDTVPVWARDEVGAMFSEGIFSSNDGADMSEGVCREEAAEYLYKLAQR